MGKERRPSTHVGRTGGALRRGLVGLVLLSCVYSALAARPAGAASSSIAIVVHPDTPVSDMSLAEVRKIFLGDRQFWNSNLRVVLLVRAPVAREREVVLRAIYQMSEAQFRQYWIAKVFRAETTSGPKIVYSAEMTNELITAIPGSIGFMPAEKVQPGMKVLRINGKLPGESGYPLQ